MAVLETSRLRLRLMEARDEAMFCHLYTDPEVMRRILPPLSAEAAAQSFARACNHNAKDTPGHRFWAIDYTLADSATSDTTIGMAALLRNGWWNRGISSEAFVPLIDHAFLGMELTLVYAQRPDDDHARIIDKLLDKFGFVHATDRLVDKTLCRWELPRSTWEERRGANRQRA
jgi:RimJ/RimL family protein N-acetyltransferase